MKWIVVHFACLPKCLVSAEASFSQVKSYERRERAEINCLAVKKWLLGTDSSGLPVDSSAPTKACLKCHLSLMILFDDVLAARRLFFACFLQKGMNLCLVLSACKCKNSTWIYWCNEECSAVQFSLDVNDFVIVGEHSAYRLVVKGTRLFAFCELPVGANQ